MPRHGLDQQLQVKGRIYVVSRQQVEFAKRAVASSSSCSLKECLSAELSPIAIAGCQMSAGEEEDCPPGKGAIFVS